MINRKSFWFVKQIVMSFCGGGYWLDRWSIVLCNDLTDINYDFGFYMFFKRKQLVFKGF